MPLHRRHSIVSLNAFERGGVIGLVTLLLYVFLAPSHIVDGDNAEFVTLGALGGTAHPTGYPSYVLWLRAWSWLPGNAAHSTAIATAILGAAQMVVLVNACRAWGAGTAAANAAVAIFAGAPVILAMYTEAEVFAMNGLVAALVIWLAAREAPLRGPWRCGVLALVAGLGMANHVTCTLLAPVGLLGVVRGIRETERKGRAIGFAIAGFVLGLTPYLYLLIAPEHAGTWGKPETLGDLMHLFLRTDYGGPGSFAARGDERYPVENLVAFGETLVRTWLWVPGIAGVAMVGYRIARPTGETRIAWLVLAASFLIAGPLLVLRFNLLPGLITTTYVIERFHILPMLVLVVFVAAALDLAFARVPERLRSPRWGAVLLVVGFAAIAGRSLGHIVRAHAPAVEEYVRNMLRSLPENAVVIGATDDLKAGTAYLQLVQHERPDVLYINWPMMGLAWYRERVVAAAGIPFTRGEPGIASVVIAERVLASGRPLFVDSMQANIVKALPHYPYGTLFRVLPRGTKPPALEEIFAINQEVYAKFELTYPRPGPDDRWPTNIHVKYAFTWRQLAAALQKAGKLEEAAWAREAAREIGPRP